MTTPRAQPPAQWVLLLVASAVACGVASPVVAQPLIAAVPASVAVLCEEIDAGAIAAPVAGQAAYIVDEAAGGVIGCDPFQPQKRWTAVAAPTDAARRPVAIACIDSSHLAMLRQEGGQWLLETFRLPAPGAPRGTATPHASTRIGPAAAGERPRLTVGFARDWLAITALEPPLPHVLAFRIKGATPGQELARQNSDAWRSVAATTASDDTLVLFERETGRPSAAARLSIFQVGDARPLLELDTGLPGLRAAACGRSDQTLWVLAGEAGSPAAPEGLWRIDAVLRNGRQAVQPVCVARLDAPRSLAWISERMILVAHGATSGRLVHVDPSTARLDAEGGSR